MLLFCTCCCLLYLYVFDFIGACQPYATGGPAAGGASVCFAWRHAIHDIAAPRKLVPVCTNPTLQSSMTLNWSLYTYSSLWFSESCSKWCTTIDGRAVQAKKQYVKTEQILTLCELLTVIFYPLLPYELTRWERWKKCGRNQAMYKENCHEIS